MSNNFPYKISNFYIISNEHLYQALKFQSYPEIQRMILKAATAKEAKKIAHDNHFYMTNDKKEHIKYMRYVLFCKYKIYSEFFNELFVKSNAKSIVELSYKDEFWGAIPEGDKLTGVNALGRLWMEIRENHFDLCSLIKSEMFLVCNQAISYETEMSKPNESNQINLL